MLAWLAVRHGRRVAVEGGLALVGTIAVISAIAIAISAEGFRDSIRYQVDRPVQVESTAAAFLYALDGIGLGEARRVEGHRSDGLAHPAADAVAGVLAAALLALVTLFALQAAARPGDPRAVVLASLGAVAAFACLGRVLSPQFLVWTVPLGALAFAWRMPALALAVALATALTQIEFPGLYVELVDRQPLPIAIVCLRDAALLAVVALVSRALEPRGQEQLLDPRRAALAVRLD